jgi:arylsulfatase A-like enzyme
MVCTAMRVSRSMVALFLMALPARLDAACDAPEPPNVILIVADDLGWADLPYFNPPIHWKFDDPNHVDNNTPPLSKQQRNLRPDLNRLAARMMADRTDGTLGRFDRTPMPPLGAGTATPTPYLVIPRDGSLTYQTPAPGTTITPARDVLEGYGGLNELARNGVAFSRYYATSGVCAPTRAAIFSGRYGQRTGFLGNGGRLQGDEVTIGEYLQQGCPGKPCFGTFDDNGTPTDFSDDSCLNGEGVQAPCYKTGLIGKWHLGEDDSKVPWKQGFDEFVGHPRGCCRGYFSNKALTCAPAPDDPSGVNKTLYVGPNPNGATDGSCLRPVDPESLTCCKPETAAGKKKKARGTFTLKGSGDSPANRTCDDNSGSAAEAECNFSARGYRDLALNFIDRHADEPYFLAVAFNIVHTGHDAPQRTQDHYRTAGIGTKSKYWGAIEEMDAAVGQIIDRAGPNTVVLFTTDQGSPGGDYGDPTLRGGKHGVYEGGIRIGLVGRACDSGPHSMNGHIASHVDIYPTIAEAARFPIDDLPTPRVVRANTQTAAACTGNPTCNQTDPCQCHYLDGQSFYPLLDGDTATHRRDFAYARYGGLAIVAREEAIAVDGKTGVCGYVNESPTFIPERGGSCVLCNDFDTDCKVGGTPVTCKKLGTKNTDVPCNVCLQAAWKLKLPRFPDPAPDDCDTPGTPSRNDHLWDLSTNPSEEDKRLDCKDAHKQLWCELKTKLLKWNEDCAEDNATACEP